MNFKNINYLLILDLCISKYERLDMEWQLKNEPLMKEEEMEHFLKIAEATGVKNPHWSGLTKRIEKNRRNTPDIEKSRLSS